MYVDIMGSVSRRNYQWKSKFGGMEAADIKRLRDVESELSQYKKMYAELAHENYVLREVIAKKL